MRQVSERRFALRGTPSDCVIMAVRHILADRPPDLVLSGVNAGQNAADDVTYSGTVAGAIEGTMLGLPSVAMSQACSYTEEGRLVPWATAETHGPRLVRRLLDFGFPGSVLYNVNFPNRQPSEVAGVAVTVQGRLAHRLHIDERRDGRGLPYYWLAYRGAPEAGHPGTDLEALDRGMISVTPLRLDMTAHDLGDPLRHHLTRPAAAS
jgi:5'-nucleotidase